MMNERQQFIATLRFERPDRIPFVPGSGRESTLAAWRRQGLPEEVRDYHEYVRRLIGMPFDEATRPMLRVTDGVSFTMIPEFEEKTLMHRPGGTIIVQDWKGNVCEISDRFDATYLRGAPDFVTRTWLKLPVESREQWPDMARRYDPDDPDRFPSDYYERCALLQERDYVGGLSFSGPFWQLREWVGFEALCMLFHDDPSFVREMIDFWQDFVARMLERVFQDFVPDLVTINEDMAYKLKPMIGPDMARSFLLPCWQCWKSICARAGVPIFEIDSDGHVGELVPVWIEAGVNCNSPLEVAAGNDLGAYRRRFGSAMAWRGGVDKRAIAEGGETLAREIERVRPVIEAGGYIPGCDHGVPPDVSWPNFVEYCRLLARVTGWL
ncbi:MAG: hypothetical protein CMJ18_07925 [Phycisphaeraceae bacterium]|nr:hypothetical protein [Phycisphaeraceae bacterium]